MQKAQQRVHDFSRQLYQQKQIASSHDFRPKILTHCTKLDIPAAMNFWFFEFDNNKGLGALAIFLSWMSFEPAKYH